MTEENLKESWQEIRDFCLNKLNRVSESKRRRLDASIANLDMYFTPEEFTKND